MTAIDLIGSDRDVLDRLRTELPLSQDTFLQITGDRAPRRRQFYTQRKATLSGCIVEHTAENTPRLRLPDSGAEGVATFIRNRSDAGSYHTLTDMDSVVRVGRYSWQMFHEGTGGNRHSIGLSIATRADTWGELIRTRPDLVRRFLAQHALAAADATLHIRRVLGIDVPRRRITAAEYRRRLPGYCSHARVDPKRRKDPGAEFPWDAHFERIDYLLEAPAMARMDEGWPGPAQLRADVEAIYVAHGRSLGSGKVNADITAWTRDLIGKATGLADLDDPAAMASPKATYAFIAWALGQ